MSAPTQTGAGDVTSAAVGTGRLSLVRRLLGNVRPAYGPVLVTYFCYGASAITGVALVFFQKDALALTPAEVAELAFWLGLPWSVGISRGVAVAAGHRHRARQPGRLLRAGRCPPRRTS